MFVKRALMVIAASFIMQPVLADDMTANDQACKIIAKACLDAGYAHVPAAAGKQFWKDCMKPTVLGKAVAGIQVDAKDIKACRKNKIKQLKVELKELKSAK